MSEEAPKDRLRRARERQGFSRERLARLLGWSASTVRAHETGQNQIRPEAAAAYRDALGISPAWLLYGTEDQAPDFSADGGRLVDVVGEVWERTRFVPIDEETEPARDVVSVNAGRYKGLPLVAYAVRGDSWHGRLSKHIIVQRPRGSLVRFIESLLPQDQVVLRVVEGRFQETAVWTVASSEHDRFCFFKGATLQGASKILHLAKDEELLKGTFVGLVVEEQIHRTIWPLEGDDEGPH